MFISRLKFKCWATKKCWTLNIYIYVQHFSQMFNIFHKCSTFFTSVQHFVTRWLTSLNIFPILVQSGLTILLWTVLKQKIVWTRTHTSCLCMHRQHFQICSLNALYQTTFSYFGFKIDIFVNIWFAPRGPCVCAVTKVSVQY